MKKFTLNKCPLCQDQLDNSQVVCNNCNFLLYWPKGDLARKINISFFNKHYHKIYNALFKPKINQATQIQAEEILRTRKQYIVGIATSVIWAVILTLFIIFLVLFDITLNYFIIINIILIMILRIISGVHVSKNAMKIFKKNESIHDWIFQKVVSELGFTSLRVLGSSFTNHIIANILYVLFIIPLFYNESLFFIPLIVLIMVYTFFYMEFFGYMLYENPSIIYNEKYIFMKELKKIQYIRWNDIKSIESEKIVEWTRDLDGHPMKDTYYNLKINLISKEKPIKLRFRLERMNSLEFIKEILLFLTQNLKDQPYL